VRRFAILGVLTLLAIAGRGLAQEAGPDKGGADLSGETIIDVAEAKTVADRMARFDRALQRIGFSARLTGCAGMIDLPAGVAGGDHSYGAICTADVAGKPVKLLLCDDDLIGHFALKASGFSGSRDAIALFVDENCTGD
jgi:hypothetical protein